MSRSTAGKAALLGAVLLGGCGARSPNPELAAATPVFRPELFFAGRTAGAGSLKIVFKDAERIRVEGNGQVAADGTLVLDQTVWRGARAPEKRQWRIRTTAQGGFAGTLSDATGRVQGQVTGNLLHLRYPMKGGVQAEQWLYLQRDGRTALNRMAITKLGLTVARLDETIRKLD